MNNLSTGELALRRELAATEEGQLCPKCGEPIGACWCHLSLEDKQHVIELLERLAQLRS